MEILKVISLLLDYPEQPLLDAEAELGEAIEQCRLLSPQQRGALRALLQHMTDRDLLDVQAEYLSLFNRGRYLSLLLFEHVHGESRDRGQAMVDLMEQYKQAGLEIDAKELPDYLPLYLEFLSTQGPDNARAGLQEVEHILALLAARLKERECNYAHV